MLLACLILTSTASCSQIPAILGAAASLTNTYVTWQLRDEVGKLYACPSWMKRWKLTDDEKEHTLRSLKERLVAFNMKFDEFCEPIVP